MDNMIRHFIGIKRRVRMQQQLCHILRGAAESNTSARHQVRTTTDAPRIISPARWMSTPRVSLFNYLFILLLFWGYIGFSLSLFSGRGFIDALIVSLFVCFLYVAGWYLGHDKRGWFNDTSPGRQHMRVKTALFFPPRQSFSTFITVPFTSQTPTLSHTKKEHTMHAHNKVLYILPGNHPYTWATLPHFRARLVQTEERSGNVAAP